MKKIVFVILVWVAAVYLTSCAKKQQAMEEAQEPLSMEALSTLETEAKVAPETKAAVVQTVPSTTAPYKPTASEIQTALKNAGYYTGEFDGKIGPLTRRATEDFQKANGLEVDGKVGPKTWSILSVYLNPPVESQGKKKP